MGSVKNGEPHFRRLEKEALKEVASQKKFVVACGGGIVINQDNIKIMKENGIVVGLSASVEVILARTKGCTHRPLLNVQNPKEKIEILLKLRAPFYAQADVSIDTSKLTIKEVVERILTKVVKHKKGSR